MKRLLDFLLVFAITLLVLNFFLPNPQKSATTASGGVLKAEKTSFAVPNIPKVTMTNSTSGALVFNTCRDLTILKDSKVIAKEGLPSTFCSDVTVPVGGKVSLNLSPLYQLFQIPGEYTLKLGIGGQEYITQFAEEVPGFWRTFFSTLFYAPVYNLFVLLISVLPGHSFGFAIILVTILIRLALMIPQHHMLVNSKKLQAIQPKIKALQEKYKGDQAKIGMELMALYKEEQVNPLGSCLPLLIQMPLLIVLYWVVLGMTDPANYYYLYAPLASFDISKINTDFFGIHLLSIGGTVGVVLALIVGAAQWLQIKLSLPKDQEVAKLEKKVHTIEKKADGKYAPADEASMLPDPHVMNRFMLWGMPGMIAVSTYFFPAGVGIYWMVGTFFMIAQQAVVNRVSNRKKTS